ncbi:MAG: hypothetical protein ACRDL3_05335 [Solirubrobacterales bacterium]
MPSEEVPESVRLVLDLEIADEGPSGRLTDDRGSVNAFFGWLELMDGVEGARRRAAGSRCPNGRENEGGLDESNPA